MADNSMMGNVTQVEQYGKNLGQVQQQVREIFKKLQQQTRSIGNVWKDDQFKNFEQEFNQNIVKSINETTAKMELMSNYVKKMVEIHRQAQNQNQGEHQGKYSLHVPYLLTAARADSSGQIPRHSRHR